MNFEEGTCNCCVVLSCCGRAATELNVNRDGGDELPVQTKKHELVRSLVVLSRQ